MNKKKAQNRFVFACLAPAVILVVIFMVIPTIDVFKTAFFKKSNFVSDATFAGFFNFKVLFNDMRFIEAMQNTILYVVLITIITLVLAVLFATLLTREEFVGKNFFRVIFYIPNILSIVVIVGIFSAIYQPTNGILNTFFGMIGLSSLQQQWMGNPDVINYSIIGALVWQAIGYYMVMHVASIDGISQEVYEAASIDGANRFKQMIHITLPGILPIVLLMSAINVSNILNAGFDQIFNLYNPVVYETGDIIDTYVYRAGLLDMQFSFATAVGLLKSVVGCILLISCNQMAKKFTDQKIF